MIRRALTVALAGLLAGCALEEGDEEGAWLDVGALRFADDGETATLTLPAGAPRAALALRAESEPGVCFQLSALIDGDGRAAVDGRSAGAVCRDCGLRTSVAVEAGLFVIPREAGRLEPDRGLALRFAQMDCETLTPLRAAGERPTLRLAARELAEVPARGTLDLRFLVTDGAILSGDEARQDALMAALERELAPAGVTPWLVEVVPLASAPARLTFHDGDPGELAALLAEAPPRDEATLDVVFGGCLLRDDPFFGPPTAVDGYTPRIPGGAGPADAVFLPGLDCFAESAGPIDPPVRVQARVLAHEIGHYLGLFHTIELDGLADPLADTGPDNLMNPRPTLATSVGLTPSQGRVMRAHPIVRPS